MGMESFSLVEPPVEPRVADAAKTIKFLSNVQKPEWRTQQAQCIGSKTEGIDPPTAWVDMGSRHIDPLQCNKDNADVEAEFKRATGMTGFCPILVKGMFGCKIPMLPWLYCAATCSICPANYDSTSVPPPPPGPPSPASQRHFEFSAHLMKEIINNYFDNNDFGKDMTNVLKNAVAKGNMAEANQEASALLSDMAKLFAPHILGLTRIKGGDVMESASLWPFGLGNMGWNGMETAENMYTDMTLDVSRFFGKGVLSFPNRDIRNYFLGWFGLPRQKAAPSKLYPTRPQIEALRKQISAIPDGPGKQSALKIVAMTEAEGQMEVADWYNDKRVLAAYVMYAQLQFDYDACKGTSALNPSLSLPIESFAAQGVKFRASGMETIDLDDMTSISNWAIYGFLDQVQNTASGLAITGSASISIAAAMADMVDVSVQSDADLVMFAGAFFEQTLKRQVQVFARPNADLDPAKRLRLNEGEYKFDYLWPGNHAKHAAWNGTYAWDSQQFQHRCSFLHYQDMVYYGDRGAGTQYATTFMQCLPNQAYDAVQRALHYANQLDVLHDLATEVASSPVIASKLVYGDVTGLRLSGCEHSKVQGADSDTNLTPIYLQLTLSDTYLTPF